MDKTTALVVRTPGGGAFAVFASDGRQTTMAVTVLEECIMYATLNLGDILKFRASSDACNHYSSSDLMWLGVDGSVERYVRDTTVVTNISQTRSCNC
jgi:nitrilase